MTGVERQLTRAAEDGRVRTWEEAAYAAGQLPPQLAASLHLYGSLLRQDGGVQPTGAYYAASAAAATVAAATTAAADRASSGMHLTTASPTWQACPHQMALQSPPPLTSLLQQGWAHLGEARTPLWARMPEVTSRRRSLSRPPRRRITTRPGRSSGRVCPSSCSSSRYLRRWPLRCRLR